MNDNLEKKAQTTEKIKIRKFGRISKWVLIPLFVAIIGAGIGFGGSKVYYKIRSENKGGERSKLTEYYVPDFLYAMRAGGEGYIQFRNQTIATGIGALVGVGLGVAGVYAYIKREERKNEW